MADAADQLIVTGLDQLDISQKPPRLIDRLPAITDKMRRKVMRGELLTAVT